MTRRKSKPPFQLSPEQAQPESKPDIFQDRVSITELKKIWNDRNITYTDEELYRIREWLYVIAGAVVNVVEHTSTEVLQEISKRKCKKPSKNCLIFFETATKKAA